MKIIEKKIEEIKPYGRNPRRNDEAVAAVLASIREFGFKVPIVIDKDNVIVCGHTRHKAAKELHLEKVPCVVADDLTDEQIKAFRLADNKVSEKAQWDMDLLKGEMSDILSIDMELFGFDILGADFGDKEATEPDYYGAERERTFEYYNLYDIDHDRLSAKWQMPTLKRCDHIPQDMISFNYAKTSKDFNKGIHFYLDDYQFERIWSDPHTYMDILKQFDCVITPDFSIYEDMPLPMKIWNIYRNRLIGQIMQDYGMKVIPNLNWCEPITREIGFEGIEPGGTFATSAVSIKRDKESLQIFLDGLDDVKRILKPKTILLYGGEVEADWGNINVVQIKNHSFDRYGK